MGKYPLEDLIPYLLSTASCLEFAPLRDQQLLQRYTKQHDESALGEVVRRHGAMVWAVCRRNLSQRPDAEDVYQVVFLKLIRQAALVQQNTSVEGWLYRVACNAAISAKWKRERQRDQEKRRPKMPEDSYSDSSDTEDLAAVLDEEVGHLPERLRSPIILCYLEGLTPEQAARRINTSTRCLTLRLAEARQWLHHQLCQRGINLDSPMLVAGLSTELHAQKVPPKLMEKTLHMVRIITQSNSVQEPPSFSTEVAKLARSIWRTWTLKAKFLLGLLLVSLLLVGGSMITYSVWTSFRGEQPREPMLEPAKKVHVGQAF